MSVTTELLYAIDDIHGHRQSPISYSIDLRLIVTCGGQNANSHSLVDRALASRRVADLLIDFRARNSRQTICLKGNPGAVVVARVTATNNQEGSVGEFHPFFVGVSSSMRRCAKRPHQPRKSLDS